MLNTIRFRSSVSLGMLFLSSTLLSGSSSTAHAQGGRDGGGGSVFVCEDGRVELIDLVEPQTRVGLKPFFKIQDPSKPIGTVENEEPAVDTADEAAIQVVVDRQVRAAFAALGKINPEVGKRALDQWNHFKTNIQWRNGDYNWTSNDVGAVQVPDLCTIRTTVMYLSANEIEGQLTYRNRMSPMHRAALEVHEVVYTLMREAETVGHDAVPARRITALLFSNLREDRELVGSMIGQYLLPKWKGTSVTIPVAMDHLQEGISLMGTGGSRAYFTPWSSEPEAELSTGLLKVELSSLGSCSYFTFHTDNMDNLERPQSISLAREIPHRSGKRERASIQLIPGSGVRVPVDQYESRQHGFLIYTPRYRIIPVSPRLEKLIAGDLR